MQIVKDYRDNKVLRDSFNGLAKKAFEIIGDDKFMFQAIAHA